jgi:hypothetical protein
VVYRLVSAVVYPSLVGSGDGGWLVGTRVLQIQQLPVPCNEAVGPSLLRASLGRFQEPLVRMPKWSHGGVFGGVHIH